MSQATNYPSSKSHPFRFAVGTRLRHVKSGGNYVILGFATIEATLTPAYVYRSLQTNDDWVRPQSEMEDGRFVVLESSSL